MKLMSPAEIRQTKETELAKDIMRTQAVKSALERSQVELDNAEAKFNAMLARQQVIWAKSNEEAVTKITDLQSEIKDLEKQREQLNFPIEDEKKKAHDLFIQAEEAYRLARENQSEWEKQKQHQEELTETLQIKLDSLSEREQLAKEREDKVQVKELSMAMEREQIRKLSQELSNKLTTL